MNDENLYKGRKRGSKNKTTSKVKDAISDIVQDRIPNVISRLDEMSAKDEVNALIQLMKFVVPTMKAQEIDITSLPEGKINPMDESVLNEILTNLKDRKKDED